MQSGPYAPGWSSSDAVAALGVATGLHLWRRCGVLTGEAATTQGADHQGMVTGDMVNTASRLQSAAEPGWVLVGDATYRAASGAIAFEAAGALTLKGKEEHVSRLARAPGRRRAPGPEPDGDRAAVRRAHRGAADGQGRSCTPPGARARRGSSR